MRKHILLVEDQALLRKLYAEVFSEAGYTVTQAEDGKSALEALEQCRPDIIVTDIRLPWVSGVHFINQVRTQRETAHLPIVALSGGGDEYLERANACGATVSLPKSADFNRLLGVVEQALTARPCEQ